MIYLASPYSHDDPRVRDARYEAACEHVVLMLREGRLVYSPIVHSHALARRGLPGDWPFWEAHDRVMLGWSGAVEVLQLPGWETSEGVLAEIAIAARLGLPVAYSERGADSTRVV